MLPLGDHRPITIFFCTFYLTQEAGEPALCVVGVFACEAHVGKSMPSFVSILALVHGTSIGAAGGKRLELHGDMTNDYRYTPSTTMNFLINHNASHPCPGLEAADLKPPRPCSGWLCGSMHAHVTPAIGKSKKLQLTKESLESV